MGITAALPLLLLHGQTPSKEYVRLGGRVVAIEQGGANISHPKSRIGVFRNGTFYLDDGDFYYSSATDLMGGFGQTGDIPVLGDWDGSGKTKVGVFRNGEWFLDSNGNGVYDPGIDLHGYFGGSPGDVPVVGDWTGSGRTQVGVFRPASGAWILDTNGNLQYDLSDLTVSVRGTHLAGRRQG